MAEKVKKHKVYEKGEGKKIDSNLFMEGYRKWCDHEMNLKQFAEYVHLSPKTLNLRLAALIYDGIVPGKYFFDGKPCFLECYRDIAVAKYKESEEYKQAEAEKAEKAEMETKTNEVGEIVYPKLI